MEIYNEVEEMDDDDEVSLNHLTTSLCSWWVGFSFFHVLLQKSLLKVNNF